MIKFVQLSWSNVFSYGEDNTIQFDKNPLTQLVGKNGHGKSSIALILEEVLFNTNSKKIKKADILNRHRNVKNYTIKVDFEKDGIPYSVSTTRSGSSANVVLKRGSEDISSHTSTGTYKQIEYILGFDHKTFSQIVYQSSSSSLEFLTATDTARKKFLIELLNLTKYNRASEVFKELAAGETKHVDSINTKLATIRGWLNKYQHTDLVEKELEEEIAEPTSILNEAAIKTRELENIDSSNKKVSQNLTYKNILESIDVSSPVAKPDTSSLENNKLRVREIQRILKDGQALCSKPHSATIKCPTCSQDMDNSIMYNRIVKFEDEKPSLQQELARLAAVITKVDTDIADWQKYDRSVQEWEKYHALYDPTLPDKLLNKDELLTDIVSLKASAKAIQAAIDKTRAHNRQVAEHNSKVKVIKEQLAGMQVELTQHNEELVLALEELSKLQILVKSFSTTGLVAYKIECLVKDLEDITNKYLTILGGGRFQLSFQIASADKLNVVITDNGIDIGIEALSNGERARVNVSTLLAIRSLMQSLSNSRTNLLIMDETIDGLDDEGKEKLIEILLAEESLNTFLVSHGYSHPLLEKILITKKNNISRLE